MNNYTVKQLAELAGVTVKTLHYYDTIGLLEPAERSESDYRLYGPDELLRLQQILLYREMEVPLQEVKAILDDPDFDVKQSLQSQKRRLLEQQKRSQELVRSIERTLKRLEDESALITDEELYAGFSQEQRQRYDREAEELYGDEYHQSQESIRKLTKGEWKDLEALHQRAIDALRSQIGADPGSEPVQDAVRQHYRWIEHFYPCSAERYRGLAELYVTNPEFEAFYEKAAPGLAAFLSAAMKIFADQELS